TVQRSRRAKGGQEIPLSLLQSLKKPSSPMTGLDFIRYICNGWFGGPRVRLRGPGPPLPGSCEDVVVAGRSVVVMDHGGVIEEGDAQGVNAAPRPLAVGAPVAPLTSGGPVGDNLGVGQGEEWGRTGGRVPVEDAAARPVAAEAAVAARRGVHQDGAIGEHEG